MYISNPMCHQITWTAGGKTPLHYAASQMVPSYVFQLIYNIYSLWMHYWLLEDSECAEILLNQGANKRTLDFDGKKFSRSQHSQCSMWFISGNSPYDVAVLTTAPCEPLVKLLRLNDTDPLKVFSFVYFTPCSWRRKKWKRERNLTTWSAQVNWKN